MNILRTAICLGITFAAYGGLHAAPPVAATKNKITLDLAAQPTGDALNEFAHQAGLQVVFYTKVSEGLKFPGLTGKFTAEEALKQLLANTQLRYEFINAHTIAIRPVAGSSGANPQALLSTPQTNLTAMATEMLRIAQDGSGFDSAEDTQKQGKKSSASSGVEEMVVEGEREKSKPFSTPNLDLTRTKDDVLPFTTFTAKDIQLSGSKNLDDFLQNRLAQNFNADIPAELDGSGLSQTSRLSRVNLRGWGENETVFLLNGRRMPAQYVGTNSDTQNATPNLNSIPIGSIERIEILPSAGSVIYGASATGGVVNIITRQDYKGGQLTMNYASPADVHAPARGVDVNYGTPMPWGTSLRLAAGYSENYPLHVEDRADVTILRWRQYALQRDPSRITLTYGATPNISIATGTPNPGTNLFGPGTATFATVRNGYAGGAGLAGFNPGVYNLELAESSAGYNQYGRNSRLGTVNDNTTFSLGVDKNFSKDWRWSVDYHYAQNESLGRYGGIKGFNQTFLLGIGPFVPAASPINPFGQDVFVTIVDPYMERDDLINRTTNVTWDISTTLHGNIGEWRGFADFSYSKNRNYVNFRQFYEPSGGWYNAFLTGIYNPFVDTRVTAPGLPTVYQNFVMQEDRWGGGSFNYQSAIKVSGPVFRLPAGAVQLTVGADWSKSGRLASYNYRMMMDGLTGETRQPARGQFDFPDPEPGRDLSRRFEFQNSAVYGEANIPLISSAQSMPLVNKLELFAAGRIGRDMREGNKGNTTTGYVPYFYVTQPHVYAMGLRYDMVEGFALRASTSIGFKPPGIGDVRPGDPPSSTSTTTITDPRRPTTTGAGETVILRSTQWVSGGNADLLPETTDAKNFGIIFTPGMLPGTRISLDYLHSIRNDAIVGLSAQTAVNLEADLPGRVQRGAPNGHSSGVGPITFVDYRTTNFRKISSKSLDIAVDKSFQEVFGGQLRLAVAATKNISFKLQSSATTGSVEQVKNRAAAFGQQIRWNGNTQLQWEGRRWGFGWSARYYDSLLVAVSDQLLQGVDVVGAKVNHDAFVTYSSAAQANARGWQSVFSGASLTLGIRNVFDREPRFWAAAADRGVAPFDSIEGRSVWLQMRKEF